MDKVSYAMAVYNGERFIVQQIESILQQMEADDELIISYDKSTDQTYDIIKRFEKQNSCIRVVENKKKGVTNNFSNAIDNCSGSYIFISDQDDIWLDNKRKVICEEFHRTGANLVIHNGVHIDTDNNIISESFFDMHKINGKIIPFFLIPRYSGCCMAFDQKIKDYILPIPDSVNAYDYWIGVIGRLKGTVSFVPDILIHHRMHENNVTPKSSRPVGIKIGSRLTLLFEAMKRIRIINA